MNDGKTHYEILGLSTDATPEQVKKRFRELARKYHPDVNRNNPSAHETFLRLNEAYEVLNDASRRASYDLSLRDKARKAGAGGTPGGAGATGGAYRPGSGVPGAGAPGSGRSYGPPPGGVRFGDTYATPGAATSRPLTAQEARQRQAQQERERRERESRRQDISRLLEEARISYRRGHIKEAQRLCEAVLEISRVGPAHELLGDILARQSRFQEAANHYTIAAQMTPANGLIMAKFNRMNQQLYGGGGSPAGPAPVQAAESSSKQMSFQLGVSCLGFALIVFLMFWSPSLPTNKELLGWPFVEHWSFGQLIFMALNGFLTGTVLAVAGWLGQPEHEIIFPTLSLGFRRVRMWVGLLVIGALSFPAAAVLYVLQTGSARTTSRAVLGLIGVSAFLTFGFALLHDKAFMETLVFGGNVIFTMSILGWFIGDLFRPSWAG